MPKETFLRLRDEKQNRILRSAIHEFVENGYERAKIGDIAKNADIAAGSLYQYFDDKENLFVYSTEWATKVLFEKMYTHFDLEQLDIFEYLQQYLAAVQTVKEDRELILFFQTVMKETSLAGATSNATMGVGADYGKKLLQNSKRRGTVRSDIDDDLLMDYFVAISEKFGLRCITQYWDFASDLTPEQEATLNLEMQQMIDLLKSGMGG
ncbi:TetR/AcrR family transcriptional regulator [Eubacteriales bacterium OttesenSCG-928-K08]|nr:TetR/AcrR family transcriptional regulator [Eubacteriales bacterium OttesenSCG-928-K08]